MSREKVGILSALLSQWRCLLLPTLGLGIMRDVLSFVFCLVSIIFLFAIVSI